MNILRTVHVAVAYARLGALIPAALFAVQCAEDPSYTDEVRKATVVSISIDGAPGENSADAAAATATPPAEDDVTAVFESLQASADDTSPPEPIDPDDVPDTVMPGSKPWKGGNSGNGNSNSGSGGGGGGTGGTEDGGDVDTPSGSELKACAKLQGVAPEKVVLVDAEGKVSLPANAVTAIKLTGNKPRLELTVTSGDGASIAGLCLFLAGNQAEAHVTLGTNVGRLIYVGRGNMSRGEIIVEKELAFAAVDLAGNQASLHMHGDGTFTCPTARLAGHDTRFDCE